MPASMLVMTVGQTTTTAERLRQKLASAGVACAPAASLPLETAVEALSRQTAQPDVVFFQCDGQLARDCAAIAQLRASTAAQIAAVARLEQPRDILEFIRAGASDCLSDAEKFREDLTALVSRLKSQVGANARRGQVISVISASGGCGASTVAANLTAVLARKRQACSLIELKIDGGDLAAMLNLQPQHTLMDLCAQAIEIDQEMLEKSLAEHPSGIRLLPSPPASQRHGPATIGATERILGLAAGLFSHVVIDLEDAFHREHVSTILASDAVLVVLRLEFPCLVRTRRLLVQLHELGLPPERIHLVVNRHLPKNQLRPAQVIEALGQPIAHCLPDDYALAATASNVGSPLVVESPSSRLSAAFEKLAAAFVAANQPATALN